MRELMQERELIKERALPRELIEERAHPGESSPRRELTRERTHLCTCGEPGVLYCEPGASLHGEPGVLCSVPLP
jgi:hypothetical protein